MMMTQHIRLACFRWISFGFLVFILLSASAEAWVILPTDQPSSSALHLRSISVEQVDLKSGEVLATFPTISDAAKAAGTSQHLISRVLRGERKSAAGSFWRKKKGSTAPLPAADVFDSRAPVEMLCPETGKVLRTFESAAEAARVIGIQSSSIHRVLKGIYQRGAKYFWRYVGSSRQPPTKLWHSTQRRSVVQICPKTGQIVATFRSMNDAGGAFGVSRQAIFIAIRHKNKCKGFYWDYETRKSERFSQEENTAEMQHKN